MLYRFLPNYLSDSDSVSIQKSLTDFLAECGLEPRRSQLILDGGNVVDNDLDRGKAILTSRVLGDNRGKSSEQVLKRILQYSK